MSDEKNGKEVPQDAAGESGPEAINTLIVDKDDPRGFVTVEGSPVYPGPQTGTAGGPEVGPETEIGNAQPPPIEPPLPGAEPPLEPPAAAEEPVPDSPTLGEVFAMGRAHFGAAEWDLAVLRAANAIRGDSERFKACRALPGGANVH